MSAGRPWLQHTFTAVLKVWAGSRKKRSRARRALHGNIKVVVANASGLSNLHLAPPFDPDVALVQELWTTREEVHAATKQLGYVVAAAEVDPCLGAVLHRSGTGQQLQLPARGERPWRAR